MASGPSPWSQSSGPGLLAGLVRLSPTLTRCTASPSPQLSEQVNWPLPSELPASSCVYFTKHLRFCYVLSELHSEPVGQQVWSPQFPIEETQAQRLGVTPRPRRLEWWDQREPKPRLSGS